MIVGIGIDIVELARIDAIYTKFGDRFLKRILGPAELADLPQTITATFIAGRFAAKEAAAKALGLGFSGGIGPAMFEILNSTCGQPQLYLRDLALAAAKKLNVATCHLSISHERHNAIALVILEN